MIGFAYQTFHDQDFTGCSNPLRLRTELRQLSCGSHFIVQGAINVSASETFTHTQLPLTIDGVQLNIAAIHRRGELAPIVFLHGFSSTKGLCRDRAAGGIRRSPLCCLRRTRLR